MKRKIILILFLGLGYSNIQSQNLVPNPSFEDTVSCPYLTGQCDYALGWQSFRESPDYFNSCNSSGLGVPLNVRGNQAAFDGNGYIGIGVYHPAINNIREIIGRNLNQPLVAGTKYYFSFFVSLADNSGFNCTSNKLGIKFTNTMYSQSNPAPIDNSASYYTDSLINDTINWVQVKGEFIPTQSYQYIMVGNFFEDSLIDTLNCSLWSYYYIDRICVSVDSFDCYINTSIHNLHLETRKINVYPNITKNIVNIFSEEKIKSVDILTNTGRLMMKKVVDSNHYTLDLGSLSNGIYFLVIHSAYNFGVHKIILNKPQ